MSELENDEVGKCRCWLMPGWQMSCWQASELDFDVDGSLIICCNKIICWEIPLCETKWLDKM